MIIVANGVREQDTLRVDGSDIGSYRWEFVDSKVCQLMIVVLLSRVQSAINLV
jgi:hypothetical protein